MTYLTPLLVTACSLMLWTGHSLISSVVLPSSLSSVDANYGTDKLTCLVCSVFILYVTCGQCCTVNQERVMNAGLVYSSGIHCSRYNFEGSDSF